MSQAILTPIVIPTVCQKKKEEKNTSFDKTTCLLTQSEFPSLLKRFASKLEINPDLKRTIVSFQANKKENGYRWFKYKEGFSSTLVYYVLRRLKVLSGTVLDPFAGAGTTLFAGSVIGLDTVGIELLPVGCELIKVRSALLKSNAARVQAQEAIQRWLKNRYWLKCQRALPPFPHLRITDGAFPPKTELAVRRFLAIARKTKKPLIRQLMRLIVLCILEEISYTRKDGQYLRWDYRSGRRRGAKPFNKGKIKSFDEAIIEKLEHVYSDLSGTSGLPELFPSEKKRGRIRVISDSCLAALPKLASSSFDCIVTSPPYCNRYDYTRTYALELAALGVNEDEIRCLRQTMLSCTVENRAKLGLDSLFSAGTYSRAVEAFNSQKELQFILSYLDRRKAMGQLNNSGIPRMLRNYFFELSLVIFEGARVLKRGAPFVMVNDNVRYDGIHVPVDLILSDIALKAGFEVEKIWVLPTGKGNSSQQMGQHGREELRKCVYIWRRL